MKKKIFINKRRIIGILIFICTLFLALAGRLFYVMAVISPKYKAIAEEQQKSELQINAKRGRILDRNANELAVSMDVYRIDLDLKTLRQTLNDNTMTSDELANKLASILNMKPDGVNKILNTILPNGLPASSAVLKRQVEKAQIDKIKALNIRGIIVSSDPKRYYTNGNFLSSVLGYVNSDDIGVSGVELSYNKELSGTSGNMTYEKDVYNNPLPYNNPEYVQPVDGKDVVLTIDETIQDYVEKAAQKALEDNKAKAVNIIVMNPKSGEILAMASKPSLDLNNQLNISSNSKDVQKLWKNASVQDNFEPGSIFKVITSASALENNIGLNDTYIDNGSIKIGNTVIHCWNLDGHGKQNFVDIIKNSCNVGFVELGLNLGKDKLIAFAQKMGFGEKTGIDLPGESSGILRNPGKTNDVDLATLAFGQGVGVTQVQYMAAFNAIANGGTWIRPHVMKDIVHFDDKNKMVTDKIYSDYGKKNVFDANLASTLRQDLIKVVTEGVGQNAFVQGLDIAGKTGTAQVADPATGKYAPGKYMSSFAGMAPAGDPKITLLVSINEPEGSNYYAGEVSAPVARELFKQIFNYTAIKGEVNVLGK
ncbi:stage V sporulation protein D [Clostridium magnum]|uniref:Stage V sporulation protein D n=1 Tax=Clostridium magnum DSM 2767 TaxID=1121326 RepID=A0A162TQH0_9CLOT|nr:stage V sporulation protein D [Clostridium magnum]KZL92921.1 stage V sporulation protein D [Clostridium magnum DSM 2767]SHJ16331.1 stage V sporulation protein D (sporulation-specific penicillin-binding protein) [Clostridium magnum DSM 2767]